MPWYFYNSSGELLTVATATATDSDAVHDNVSGEIAAVALKASPVSGDLILIEDSAAANVKKRVTVGTVGVTDHGGLTGLGDDDHTQYRLESEDHTHQSAGLQGGQLDHGLALTGLSDDDHTIYLLASGARALAGNLSVDALITIDGRDLSVDGTKLDGIETGATADQNAADIRGLGFFDITNDGTGSGLDADLVDGQHRALTINADHTHQSTGAQGGQLDHGLALTGLTDDDHTQYALLAGRSGGQELQGGTGASEALTLDATSHATKGDIVLQCADLTFLSTARARMAAQNRFRYLNIMCRVTISGVQTISTGTPTAVAWDVENFDTDGIHDNVTNNSRFTAPIAGKYWVYVVNDWTASTSNTARWVQVRVNGTFVTYLAFNKNVGAASDISVLNGGVLLNLAATDYVEFFVQQDTGGDLDLRVNTFAGLMYVGE